MHHDHDCGEADCGGSSLHEFIDRPKIRVLNAANPNAAGSVFKPWDQRRDTSTEPLCSDDDDPDLIIFVPFTSDVKIKSIMVVGGDDDTGPTKLKAFTNREDIDFTSAADTAPVQEWDIQDNPNAELEYTTRYTKFQGVANLTLYFTNTREDKTAIRFIGLRGEGTSHQRKPVMNVVYESRPQPQDHAVPGEKPLPPMNS